MEVATLIGLTCPITQLIFEDPVVADDGHTYSRAVGPARCWLTSSW